MNIEKYISDKIMQCDTKLNNALNSRHFENCTNHTIETTAEVHVLKKVLLSLTGAYNRYITKGKDIEYYKLIAKNFINMLIEYSLRLSNDALKGASNNFNYYVDFHFAKHMVLTYQVFLSDEKRMFVNELNLTHSII